MFCAEKMRECFEEHKMDLVCEQLEWLEALKCEVCFHHYTHRSVNALVSLRRH